MLENTGERIIPDLLKPTSGLYLEHIARYYFSIPYITGRVLDIACGTGYGTQFIAKSTKNKGTTEIIGVDLDPLTIKYAKERYNHQLISYEVADGMDLTLAERLGQFDTILSFETIEHVPDDKIFMENLYKMLRPGGTLVISTPFGEGRGKPCGQKFHYHQLTPGEFETLFEPFSHKEIYYQRGVTIEPPRDIVEYKLGVAVVRK